MTEFLILELHIYSYCNYFYVFYMKESLTHVILVRRLLNLFHLPVTIQIQNLCHNHFQ